MAGVGFLDGADWRARVVTKVGGNLLLLRTAILPSLGLAAANPAAFIRGGETPCGTGEVEAWLRVAFFPFPECCRTGNVTSPMLVSANPASSSSFKRPSAYACIGPTLTTKYDFTQHKSPSGRHPLLGVA